ncbi:DNA mismatch repair endonuclease MutL [Eubacteriales bacterium OttesenSCG-928-N13]|nr:DNA mismatch repair endonuclease MutL [Eubacteriales bacterium OttesenSCG-928-N13]
MPIRILDAITVGQIAAGEVVERPSSVAKELIENSLDAGATAITIEIREGGNDYLRVTDNGSGIAHGEVKLAFENHATSKLGSGKDLDSIMTLGFRGEALPSIAAVSKVEINTRQKGRETGIRMRIRGGEIDNLDEAGCPEGTTIIVRDLFYNIPARRSFLKRGTYEAGIIVDLVEKMILGNVKVSIRLISNGKTVLNSFGDGNITHAALAVYGRENAAKMMAVDVSEGGMRMYGLIGVGECARANRSQQSFFINNRLVRCPMLAQAFEEACRGRVMIGMHPICALHVDIPMQSVDVNVHPNKLEVRFKDEEFVLQKATALFEQALKSEGMLNLESVTAKKPPVFERPPIQYLNQNSNPSPQTEVSNNQTEVSNGQTEVVNKQTDVQYEETDVGIHKDAATVVPTQIIQQEFPSSSSSYSLKESYAPAPSYLSKPRPVDADSMPTDTKKADHSDLGYKLVGVAFNTYVFIEVKDDVLIIDQHAAHERLLYEKYKVMLEKGNASQQLLTPIVIELSKYEYNLLIDNQTLLDEIGYEIEPFGERAIQMRAVPHVLGKADLKPLFMSMLEHLDQLKGATFERRRIDIIKFSCKRAVKAGDRLTEDEITTLIHDMMQSDAPPTCPHGRPVVKTMSKASIERMFKRQ